MFTWFPQPGELARQMDEWRDSYARDRYRDAQRDRYHATPPAPLYPEFDTMTGAEREEAGFYDGFTLERPGQVSPVTWQLGLEEHARMHGQPRELSREETARGYDIHGRPC
jgi:hypothetical protein